MAPSSRIRIGTNKDTRGTAFVVYKDIYDAKNTVDHLHCHSLFDCAVLPAGEDVQKDRSAEEGRGVYKIAEVWRETRVIHLTVTTSVK